ncbi:MAG: helix-turn-helix domain-containing protein [Myxococcales bacterium]|nr:helix-turn-helix domain-containing protein [Myxococcales bacterium]
MIETSQGFAPGTVFLTRLDVARLLKLSPASVYRFVERGLIPVYRVCNRLRFLHEDILAFMEARRVSARDSRHYERP